MIRKPWSSCSSDSQLIASFTWRAKAGVRASREEAKSYQETNVAGTTVLLEATRRADIKRFVFVSSSTGYGIDVPAPFDERGPLGVPASPYGVTKRAAELMVLNYHNLHALPTVIVRPLASMALGCATT